MELLWTRLEPGDRGHDAAYRLLGQAMGEPLPEIQRTKQGKPYFPEGDLHFSISHTARHAFCCLSERNVGIDAEEIGRRIDLRLAERWLSDSEKCRLEVARDREDTLLRLWVLKESYAKLTGRGLGNYLKNTDLSPEDPKIQVIDGCYVVVLEEGDLYAL